MLVDGYNLCGAWPKLKKHFMRGDLEEARERLISEVLPYRSYAGENVNHPMRWSFVAPDTVMNCEHGLRSSCS